MPYHNVVSVDKNIQKYQTNLKSTYHLFSFAYKKIYQEIGLNVPKKFTSIDSGAFTIKNTGINLNITDYIKFLNSIKNTYQIAFNFDEIGNAEQTYKNQKYIEEQGLEVIPVFHLGSQYKHLQKYIDEGYDYISLGGMVQKSNKLRETFLRKCFALGSREGIKFHGFGLSHKYCDKYPFYSIDNSNHIMVRRKGEMNIKGNKIRIPRVQGKTPEERAFNDAYPVLIQLKEFQREYKELVKKRWVIYHSYFKGTISYDEVIG